MMNISTHWRYLALVSFLLTTYFSYAVGRNLNVTTVRLRQKRQQGAELYLPSTFVIPGGEGGPGWGAWGSPSPCSRSCGGGVSKQSRRCEDVEADGRPRCRGGDSKYFSCNTQDCPENSLDFRSLQCSHYDSTPFEGVTYEWVPYTKAPNPCELNCMPRGERFYYRHDNKVADGTPCNEESLDVCVNGECLPVGCDMMLGSNAREDNCRQCGGDGSSCKTTSGVYDKDDLTVGYNDILLIPQGATNIVITEQRPSNNYLAIRNKAGDFYLNGNWRIDFPRAFTFAGAIWHYERKPQGFAAPDSIRCLGPTSEPVYLVILYQSTNVGISYEYSVPQGIAHSTDDEYAWVNDAFTHCSASCGGGFQVRNVTCASQRELTPVDDSLCDAALRPAANQSCADIACAARWVESEWDQCSQPCGDQGVQSRQIYCQKIVTRGLPSVVSDEECFQLLGPKPPQHQKCNVGQPCPDWHVGPWYPCDKLCGEGKQRRNVRCYRKVDGKIEVLDDDQCAQEKPEKEKSCFIHPCDGVDWVLSDWSGCDSCLSKVKTRSAHCATQKGEVFPDSFCSNHPEPELQADCDAALLPACDVQWYTSQWSKCSGKCGDGVKSRRVFCGLFNGEALQKVANDRCEAPEKPEDTQPCELDEDKKDCPAEWHAGPFSECSKPCGGGEQARKVLCLRENKTVPITECDESNILEQTQQCNKEACDDDEILPMEVGSTQPVTDYEEEEWCDDEDYDDESDGVTSAMDESATETTLDDLMMSDGPSYTEVTGSGDYEETSIADGSGDALSTYIPEVDTSVDFTDDGSGDETTPSEESTTSGSTESTSSDVDLTSSSSDSSSSESFTDSGISTESSSTDESSTDLSSTESTDASSSTDISSTDSSSESSTDSSSESTDSTPIDSSTDSSSTDNASTDVSSTDGASTDASSTDDSSTDVSSTDASSTDVSSEGSSTDDSSTEASSTDSSSTDASSTDISSTDGSSTDSSSTDSSSTDSSSTDSSSTDSSSTDSSSTDSSSTDSSSTDISSTDSSSEATTDITTESSTDGGTTTEEDGLRVGEFDPESSITKATTDESSTDISESTSEGSTDSSTDGSTDSSTDGSTDSSTDVSTDGSTDSSTDGSTDSSTDGSTDSSTDGSTDATSESSTDSSSSTEDSSTIESSTYDGLTTEISSTDSSSTEESSTDASTDQSSTEESTSESSTSESSSDSSESSSEMSTDSGYSTTEETESSSSAWGWSLSTLGQTKEKKCKRRPKKACLTSQFGCCFDNKTAATGPFEKGCPNPKTCKETKHGCCPDGVSPAQGADGKGCPLLACNETLFGCCSDKKSAAQGNNQEDCPPPCKSSKFGCCADGKQEAEGPKKKGCPESIVATTVAPTVHCSKGKHGCCEDNSTAATGPSKAGCPCSTTQHGCCPDQQSAATGPNLEGCVFACSSATFGCCPDRETAAHGPNGEGCCITQPFGCCPDNIVAARGPEFEGCGCQWSPYGCCPGNETAARGYNNEGCGCQHTPHGCCPNRYTPALGPKFEGCPCHTYQFGCCPDGKQVARGPRAQGCGCKDSEFGCCSDDQTPAGGPDKAGCDCAASKFGCCPDGQAEATGEEFAGCEDKPENLQAVCGMEKDRGSCRNYTVKWYYDLEYGGCSRFWYGGCDGNNNRFRSQEECKDVCVQPVGRDACKLPKVKGPCEGYYPTWYFDSERKQCGQFIYGGCLGNNNRFQTREECQKQCDKVAEQDVCSLKTERGQCAGAFTRWSFNADSRSCQPFNWGGCEGNANRFISESACILQCDTPGKMKVQDICTLPSVTGECAEYKERWFYDSAEKRCRQFYYGGCGGNSNNFPSEQECETRCSDQEVTTTVQPVETYGTEICFLRVDTRPCTDSSPRWHYDSTDGVCKQFLWGSCQQRNHNTFSSRAECESFCSSVQDLCQLPMAVGPCDASLTQWFYDKHSDACSQFAYGGCQGNNNRFGSKSECEQRCKQGPSETTEDSNAITPVTHRPEDVLAEICREPMVSGNCSERLPVWAYDEATGKCTNFLYSGCNGNRNRFLSEEQCQRHCGQFRGIEVCRYGKEEGPCRGRFVKFYFEEQRGQCLEFIWGGCAGGPNRFSSEAECSAVCREHRELPPDSATTSEEVCNQQVDSGNCEGPYFRRWYYSNEHGNCLAFIYTGCGGNSNNFKSMDACMRQCRQPSETNEINTDSDNEITDAPAPTQDPCRAYKDHCAGLQCNYGLARSLQSDGCERCSCVDPCDNMRCENGGRCVIGNYRDQNSGEIVYYPECRLENKPGQCPQDNTVDENAIAPSEERCENECRSDVDCRGDDKCCRRGCGVVCLAPHRESLPAYTIEPRWDSDVEPTGVQPPRIDESEDPEVFAEEGNIAVLRCLVYGNPAPTITWKKESIIIDGTSGRHRIMTDGALQIISLYRNDSGVYICVADNGIGPAVQREINLEVNDPTPHAADVIAGETHVVGTLGSPLVLRCSAYGWPSPFVQWWQGETMLPIDSQQYERRKDYSLLIRSLQITQLGEYTCQAYNGIGKPGTQSVVVQAVRPVNAVDAIYEAYGKYLVQAPNDPYVATPRVYRPTPPSVSPSPMPEEPSPEIVPVEPREPERVYNVPVTVNITVPQSTYPVGSDLSLLCDVEGYPLPEVSWLKDGYPLSVGGRVAVSESNRLTVYRVNTTDSGEYRCSARNLYSSAYSSVTISVEGLYIHPNCTDNPFFANCKLIVQAHYCSHRYYARFCCRSCTEAGLLPSYGNHLA